MPENKPDMYDSFSSDQAANPEVCWSCGKENCECDELTMDALDERDRNEE